MKHAIILHGSPSREQYYDPDFPSTSNYYWIPWLQKQLTIRDIPTETPEVAYNWEPRLPEWQATMARFDITSETILIGHSCGAGFLLRWLSEHPETRCNKLILAAPWIDPKRIETTDFFDFELAGDLATRTAGMTVINSDNDVIQIQDSVKVIRETIKGLNYVELHNRGHFYDDTQMTFPELLATALS